MTVKQYKAFNKITKNKETKTKIEIYDICFESLFASYTWINSTLLKNLQQLNSLINNTNSYEKFYREITSAEFKIQYGILDLKEEYLVNILKTNSIAITTFFRNHPVFFNDFYLWVKKEVLPQYNQYIINKNKIT